MASQLLRVTGWDVVHDLSEVVKGLSERMAAGNDGERFAYRLSSTACISLASQSNPFHVCQLPLVTG